MTFQTYLLLNRPRPARWRKHGCQTWSGGDGASHQQIPAAVGEARDGGLQGPGHLTVTLAQASTRVGSLHVCGLCRLVFSQHWTKVRPICYLVGFAPVPTKSGPKLANPGYPVLSQLIWWYPLPVNWTILVPSLLEKRSIWPYERWLFAVRWQCSHCVSNFPSRLSDSTKT